jgi:hypothetical protein
MWAAGGANRVGLRQLVKKALDLAARHSADDHATFVAEDLNAIRIGLKAGGVPLGPRRREEIGGLSRPLLTDRAIKLGVTRGLPLSRWRRKAGHSVESLNY